MADEPGPAEVAGKKLTCPVCGGKDFHRRRASIHGNVAAFFSLEWLASKHAELYVCARCGNVQWFVGVKEAAD